MITRRRVLESGLAVGAAAAGASAFPAAAALETPDLFVYDARRREAAAAAADAARLGAAVAGAGDDLADLWRSHLRPLMGAGPCTIAGVTTPGALLIVETLAADHRLRVLSRTSLSSDVGTEPLVSWVIGPPVRGA